MKELTKYNKIGNNMEKTFEQAMAFRHACKIFDETKKISDENINYILEAGEHLHHLLVWSLGSF